MIKESLKKTDFLDDVFVVLINPLYSGNVGAVARSMVNFGLSKLVIVGDFRVDDECRNRAKHANFILDNIVFVESFDSARASFDIVIGSSGVVGSDFNLSRSPLLVEEVVSSLKGFKGRVGLFFGPEDSGLSVDELLLCDFIINIPCSSDYGVMNLSHAATIIFYEFFKAFSVSFRASHALASVKEKDVAYSLVEDILSCMDFKSESDLLTQRRVWRNILGKSFISKREISSLLGFFRNVLFRFKK